MKISLWLKIVFFFVVFFSTIAFNSRIVFGASIAIDAGSVGNVLNGINSFSSGGFNFSSMNPAMLPSTYDSINQYLYSNFGYDVNDAIDFSADNLTGWATGQTSNPINGASELLTAASTNFVANTMKAGLTAQSLLENGYQYFAQRVPQWGENAKQFFIGKVDDLTGTISDIGDGFVTKVSANGLLAYNQIYDNLVNSGDISLLDGTSGVCSYNFRTSFPNVVMEFESTFPIYYFTSDTVYETVNNQRCYWVQCAVPKSSIISSYPYKFSLTGHYVRNGSLTNVNYGEFDSYGLSDVTVNGVEYIIGKLRIQGLYCLSFSKYGNYSHSDIQSILGNITTSESLSYDYSSSVLSQALKDQLDRLIGKYVDSLTLQRVNDIVASIPIGGELVGEIDVPVAIPTQAIVDELTGIIDQAIEDSVIYDTVFDAYYDVAIDTPVDPDPPVDDSDIYVPIDVPVTPIDTIGSALTVPYMFSSIFEPIFLAFGGGLFSLWLFVPTLIIFVAIIWAIK